MRLLALTLSSLLLCYAALLGPFTAYMNNRPVQEKVGYIPRPQALRVMAADYKELVAAGLVFKSMFYYGGLVDKRLNRLNLPPDFFGMYHLLATALKLDPYNMDAYYFCQAFMVWDVGQISAENSLLEYGMKYRTWDFYLPLFAGFNYAYFLKDYEKAAKYYRRAGELSGAGLYLRLTARYLYEAGETELAIGFLEQMIRGGGNEAVRNELGIRLEALKAVRKIEIARNAFSGVHGKPPDSIDELLAGGFLAKVPPDPYGGKFYLDEQAKVRTTSKFSFAQKKQ